MRGISREFGEFGVSTSTYAATWNIAEGDDIRAEALEAHKANTDRVEHFCPALRDYDRLPTEKKAVSLRHDIARFIEQEALPAHLDEGSQASMCALLEAVLWNNEDKAMGALYLPTVRAERAVRERLLKVASRSPGGVKGLFKKLEEFRLEVKGADTITLGACLLGARAYVRRDLAASREAQDFPEPAIHAITNTRNKLMHGVNLNLQADWLILAKYVIHLFKAQTIFVKALEDSWQILAREDLPSADEPS